MGIIMYAGLGTGGADYCLKRGLLKADPFFLTPTLRPTGQSRMNGEYLFPKLRYNISEYPTRPPALCAKFTR